MPERGGITQYIKKINTRKVHQKKTGGVDIGISLAATA